MFSPMECYSRNDDAFDGLFDKAKKAVKKAAAKTISAPTKAVKVVGRNIDLTNKAGLVGKAASTKVGKILAAPLVAPLAISAKLTTAALGATGIKPLKQLDKAVGKAYRGSVVGQLRRTYGVELATGAAVGATLLTGGAAAPALVSALPGAIALGTGKAASMSLMDTVKVGVSGVVAGQVAIAGGNVAESIPSLSSGSPAVKGDEALAQTMAITGAAEVPVAPGATTVIDAAQSAVASSAAGAPPKKSVLPLAAAAGAGFLVFGPIGAVAGAAAGAFLGRKKA